jgi:catecholate siderophore receptor
VDKKGVAGAYRTGIGERDEYTASIYHLETDGRPLYNHPGLGLESGAKFGREIVGTINPILDAKNYYGNASDFLRTQSTYATFVHKRRLDDGGELKTTVRHGHYERDLLASVIRFTNNPNPSNVLNPSTSLTRGFKSRRGESNVTQIQSDYSGNFKWAGFAHNFLAGMEYSYDDAKRNPGVRVTTTPTSTYTSVGSPNDGNSVAYTRDLSMGGFITKNLGLYAQDTINLNNEVKVVGGLRLDTFSGDYRDTSNRTFRLNDKLLSTRLGSIWQPTDHESYYVSYGNSYNTSGDTYQFGGTSTDLTSRNQTGLNTPPEMSRNYEMGGKFDLFEKKAILGIALFHSEKYNERNTDVDSAANQYLLSGKRHATGMEFNFAGRITPAWEVFYNHTWIPEAKIDESSIAATGNGAQGKGDRPALTPKHSASLWSTYRINTTWRVGGGLNYRGDQNPDGARNGYAQAFTTLDTMAEYTLNDANVIKFNVSNLTNKLYADSLYRGFYAPGAPRRVELSWKSMF